MKIKAVKNQLQGRIIKMIIFQLGMGIISFALAQTVIFENFSPLSAILVSVVPQQFTPIVAFGGIIGHLSQGVSGFRYISCIIILCAIRWFFGSFAHFFKKAWFSVACCSICISVTGLAFSVLTDLSTVDVILYVGEGAMSGAVSYFFYKTFNAIEGNLSVRTSEDNLCIVISFGLCLMSLYPFEISEISPARIIAVLIILICASFGGRSVGTVAGTALGLTLFMSSKDLIFASLGYSLGGMISGLCSKINKMVACIAFVVANGAIVMQNLDSRQNLIIMYEVLIASLIFMIMPQKIEKYFSSFLSEKALINPSDGMKNNLIMRLKIASDALYDVSKITESVSEKLCEMDSNTFENIFEKTKLDVCKNCGMRGNCWDVNRRETLCVLTEGAKILRHNGALSQKDLPDGFCLKCVRPEDVISSLAENYAAYSAVETANRRLSEVRTVVSEQFDGISQMLLQLADEFEQSQKFNPALAKDVENALKKTGITPTDISCKTDISGRICIEIKIENHQKERINQSIILREISRTALREFDPPTVTEFDGYTLLSVNEHATFSVDFGICQHSKNENPMCGDAYSFFYDNRGRGVIILSDGMGSGGRAAVDGNMACSLMTRLVKAGFGFECALKLVNSAMIFKSNDESVATVDISCIDLYNGCTQFFKAGAPATVVCRNKKSCLVEGEAIPPGILEDVMFEKTELQLSKGDKIIMFSDGLIEDGTDWIGVEAEVWSDGSAQDLAEHLMDYAIRKSHPEKRDDLTVLTAVIY